MECDALKDWKLNSFKIIDRRISFYSQNKESIPTAKESISTKEVTILPSDKPWYDSEIRRRSRKRDRLKTKAAKSGKQTDRTNYKHERNKVNNLIKHAKEVFFNNIEGLLFESYRSNKRNY